MHVIERLSVHMHILLWAFAVWGHEITSFHLSSFLLLLSEWQHGHICL